MFQLLKTNYFLHIFHFLMSVKICWHECKQPLKGRALGKVGFPHLIS